MRQRSRGRDDSSRPRRAVVHRSGSSVPPVEVRSELIPRALVVAAGFLLAGLFGLGAYFVPVLQTASSSVSSGAYPNFDPRPASTAPFTVLLLGSDDDSKFLAIG